MRSSVGLLLLASTVLTLDHSQAQGVIRSFDGTASDDHLGVSVARAGDVNGDGYDDVISGAPSADPGGRADAGIAVIYSGFDSSVLYTFEGAAAGDLLGQSVSGAGDVNADGYDDVIVGAHGVDGAGIPNSDFGQATVFSGADGSVLYTFDGAEATSLFGLSVAGAGDVNRDGYDDVIVGAPWAPPNGFQSGRATVFSGIDGSQLSTIEGGGQFARLGWSVSGAGDVNGDGFDEVIVGAVGQAGLVNPRNGEAFVCNGSTGAVIHPLTLGAADTFGSSVAAAGDVNGDGFDDVVVGAPIAGIYLAGQAHVYSGIDGVWIHMLEGHILGEEFGYSVTAVGDINGDGYDDVAVGARFHDAMGIEAGAVDIFSGRTGFGMAHFDAAGPGEWFGFSIAGRVDVDNDGSGDLVVGAPGDFSGNAVGNVSVFSLRAPSFHRIVGSPCQTSGGRMPSISVSGLPAPGSTFTIELRGGEASALTSLIIGDPGTVDLGLLGAPGCTVYSNLAAVLPVPNADAFGRASLTFQLPNMTGLRRSTIAMSWVLVDVPANSLGIVASDGANIFVGD